LKLRNRIPTQPRVNFMSKDRAIVVCGAPQQTGDILHRQRMILFHCVLESVPVKRTD
jgi:hypothetical protein